MLKNLVWKYRIFLIVLSLVLFFGVNAYFLAKDQFYGLILGPVLLVIYASIFHLRSLFHFLIACVPLSLNLEEMSHGLGIALPTEPIIVGLMGLTLFKMLFQKVDSALIKHPISLAILGYLGWMALTTVTSEMPVISIKFLLSRVWFIVVFFYLSSFIFSGKKEEIERYFWLYIIPFIPVLLYTMLRHATYGFEEKAGHWVMEPIFKDHTSYGAALAFLVPFLVYKSFVKVDGKWKMKVLPAIVLGIYLLATTLSYTRAAWVSLVGALGVYLVFRLKIKAWMIMTVGLMGLGVLALSWDSIMMKMEKNTTDSSSNFGDHVKSISNISSDASNLERINRWKSAFRMFNEKPLLGFGPGTYMFKYAPYQKASEKTIISTNSGDGGNAHSDYIGPLAESGLFGMLSYLVLIFCTAWRARYVILNGVSPEMKGLGMMAFLGVITYFIHGLLNNFLDLDKISCLFFGMLAMIVVLDVNHTKKEADSEKLAAE